MFMSFTQRAYNTLGSFGNLFTRKANSAARSAYSTAQSAYDTAQRTYGKMTYSLGNVAQTLRVRAGAYAPGFNSFLKKVSVPKAFNSLENALDNCPPSKRGEVSLIIKALLSRSFQLPPGLRQKLIDFKGPPITKETTKNVLDAATIMCASLPFAGGATVVIPQLIEVGQVTDSSPIDSSPLDSSPLDSPIQSGGAPNIQPSAPSPLSQPTNEITTFLLIILMCMMISGPCMVAGLGYFMCAGACIYAMYGGFAKGGGKTRKRKRSKRFSSN